MNQGSQRPSGAGLPALQAPLVRFVFETDRWVRPDTLAARIAGRGPLAAGALPSRPDAAVLRRAVAQACPPRCLSLDVLTADLRGRLALMPREQWQRLGLCVAILPASGHILRSMDGHFRRAVRQGLDERVLEALDQHADAADPVRLLLGAGAWRDPARVAAGGIRSLIEQACLWPDPVRERFVLQFEPHELAAPSAVAGLNFFWLEIACKALWPDHPWLWS